MNINILLNIQLTLLIAIGNMANLFSVPVTSGGKTRCVINNEAKVAANILSIFLRSYIPFFIMLVLNIIVFRQLRKSKTRVGIAQTGQNNQGGKLSNKEYNFMVSTLLIDLTFVLFYIPITMKVTVTALNVFISFDKFGNAILELFTNCGLFLAYFYSLSLSCIFLILNRYFRNEVLTVLRINRIMVNFNQTVLFRSKSNIRGMNGVAQSRV